MDIAARKEKPDGQSLLQPFYTICLREKTLYKDRGKYSNFRLKYLGFSFPNNMVCEKNAYLKFGGS